MKQGKRKPLKAVGKIFLSGIIALVILTGFCFFYYNIPVHSESENGATDYKWQPNVFFSRGTEGFAWGKTNNDGYTNLFDYNENTVVDILIMGSSHMEGYQVAMEQSTASQLNALLPEDTVYNIGMSGHTFLTCVSNLEAALDAYHPTKFVVMETVNLSFTDKALTRAINGKTAEIPANTGGITGALQSIPYFRLLYAQMQNFTKQHNALDGEEDFAASADQPEADLQNNEALLDQLLRNMNTSAEKHSTRIIITYHPSIAFADDGTMQLLRSQDTVEQFQRLCEKNNILFLDMSDRFQKEYEESYVLPYGFSNSPVGSGHMNQYGHTMMADELYQLISRIES